RRQFDASPLSLIIPLSPRGIGRERKDARTVRLQAAIREETPGAPALAAPARRAPDVPAARRSGRVQRERGTGTRGPRRRRTDASRRRRAARGTRARADRQGAERRRPDTRARAGAPAGDRRARARARTAGGRRDRSYRAPQRHARAAVPPPPA